MNVYKTKGVCASKIHFEVLDGVVRNVKYIGGCPGNVIGIACLLEGQEIDDVIKRINGIDCAGKETSCPDQRAKALKEHKEKQVKDLY